MLSEDPLKIPEVAGIVASFLEGGDLARCIRVSSSWRDMFLPHRWRVVKTGTRSRTTHRNSSNASFYRVGPHPADIYYHRNLIQDLTFCGDCAGLDKYRYPHLHKLTVDYSLGAEDSGRLIFLEFMEMFPRVTEVVLQAVKLQAASWVTILGHPHLAKLRLFSMSVRDAPVFWEVCSKLESLELNVVTIRGRMMQPDTVFRCMRKLTLHQFYPYNISRQLQMISRCPELRELNWSLNHGGLISRVPIQDPIWKIPNNCWPHLNQLFISYPLHDRDVTSLLKGVGNLTSLRLEFCLLYEDSVQALRRHFPTLVNLELDHSNAIPNSTLQDVLCSCPRLEVLRGGNVFAKGVVEGGPWTCQQLRKLRTCILFEESERDLQKEMFKRLSTLTRLETLIMAAPGYDLNGQENLRVLEFRLENGLGQLASLSQLRAVVFEPNMPGYHVDEDGFEEIVNRRYFPQIGVDEIAWMKLNWKKLGRLSGFLNSDFTLSARLELMVKILDLDGDQPH